MYEIIVLMMAMQNHILGKHIIYKNKPGSECSVKDIVNNYISSCIVHTHSVDCTAGRFVIMGLRNANRQKIKPRGSIPSI